MLGHQPLNARVSADNDNLAAFVHNLAADSVLDAFPMCRLTSDRSRHRSPKFGVISQEGVGVFFIEWPPATRTIMAGYAIRRFYPAINLGLWAVMTAMAWQFFPT
jgi:hypothetical protein